MSIARSTDHNHSLSSSFRNIFSSTELRRYCTFVLGSLMKEAKRNGWLTLITARLSSSALCEEAPRNSIAGGLRDAVTAAKPSEPSTTQAPMISGSVEPRERVNAHAVATKMKGAASKPIHPTPPLLRTPQAYRIPSERRRPSILPVWQQAKAENVPKRSVAALINTIATATPSSRTTKAMLAATTDRAIKKKLPGGSPYRSYRGNHERQTTAPPSSASVRMKASVSVSYFTETPDYCGTPQTAPT